MTEALFTISQAAQEAECHRNTVSNYEGKGLITSSRDINGFRRYTKSDVLKLKALLAARWPSKSNKVTY